MSHHYDMYCREFEERQKANSCIDRLQSSIEQLQAELDTANEIIENTKKCVANNPVYIYGPGQCMLEEALKEVKS